MISPSPQPECILKGESSLLKDRIYECSIRKCHLR